MWFTVVRPYQGCYRVFFKRKKQEEDKYVELGAEVYDVSSELEDKVKIEIFNLDSYDDMRKVSEAYNKGNTICLVNLSKMVDLEFGEPHMAVKKMKKLVEEHKGDVAAIKGNWIVMTPAFASIFRKDLPNIRQAISEEIE